MPTVPSRLAAAWRQVYWNAPSFSEWPDYDDRIAPAVAAYEHTPIARVWDSTGVRALLLLLSGVGLAGAAADVGRDVQEVLDAALRSAASGRRVELS